MMALGYLAALVAGMPLWIVMTADQDELDLQAAGTSPFRPQDLQTAAALVAAHDANVVKARASLAATTDEHLMKPWRFLVGGKLISEPPRYEVLSTSVLSHLAHHRGQLTVYLRLTGQPVPALYGPSVDEGGF
jgi:uncharacterized damage-inducible protein DinB